MKSRYIHRHIRIYIYHFHIMIYIYLKPIYAYLHGCYYSFSNNICVCICIFHCPMIYKAEIGQVKCQCGICICRDDGPV